MSSAPAASQVDSDSLESAIFSGIVRHRRFYPTQHEFEYSIHMFMLKAATTGYGSPLAAGDGMVPVGQIQAC